MCVRKYLAPEGALKLTSGADVGQQSPVRKYLAPAGALRRYLRCWDL